MRRKLDVCEKLIAAANDGRDIFSRLAGMKIVETHHTCPRDINTQRRNLKMKCVWTQWKYDDVFKRCLYRPFLWMRTTIWIWVDFLRQYWGICRRLVLFPEATIRISEPLADFFRKMRGGPSSMWTFALPSFLSSPPKSLILPDQCRQNKRRIYLGLREEL